MSPKASDRLEFATLLGLINLRGLYTLGFSFIFGMCESPRFTTEYNELILTLALWVTFIGGNIIPYFFFFFLDLSRVHQG